MSTENDTEENQTSFHEFQGTKVYHTVLWVVFVVISWLQIVVGSLGTVSVLVIIICMQNKVTNHNLFVANLAFTDFITLAYWWPFFAIDLIVGYHPVVNLAHCRANGIIIVIVSEVYVVLLIFVSLNRYMHICHFSHDSKFFTRKRTKLMIVGIWISGCLFSAIPFLFRSSPYAYKKDSRVCTIAPGQTVVELVFNMLYVIAPLSFVGYLNRAIYRFWQKVNDNLVQDYTREDNEFAKHRSSDGNCSKSAIKERRNTVASENLTEREKSKRSHDRMSSLRKHGEDHTGVETDKCLGTLTCENSTHGDRILSVRQSSFDVDSGGFLCTSGDVKASRLLVASHSAPQTQNNTPAKMTVETPAHLREGQSGELHVMSTRITKESSVDIAYEPSQCVIQANRKDGSVAKTLTQSVAPDNKNTNKDTPEVERIFTLNAWLKKRRKDKRRKELAQKSVDTFYTQVLDRRYEKIKNREQRVVKSLLTVYIMTCLSFAPYGVVVVVTYFMFVPPEVLMTINMLLYFNNTCNWFVYGYMNPTIQQRYKDFGTRLKEFCTCSRS